MRRIERTNQFKRDYRRALRGPHRTALEGAFIEDSYSCIVASVPSEHPLNNSELDEPPMAVLMRMAHPEGEVGDQLRSPEQEANARFIAASRSDVPALVAECRALRARAEKAEAERDEARADAQNDYKALWEADRHKYEAALVVLRATDMSYACALLQDDSGVDTPEFKRAWEKWVVVREDVEREP